MMDNTVVEDRAGDTANLITAVPVQMVSEARVETLTKLTPVAVSSSVQQELIATQYIQLHRVPEQLHKVLVSDALSSDLLAHHVDLASAADFAQHGVTAQYYTDDLLTPELTEEDRRLAAELVAVQLKHQHQQHQSNQILSSAVSPLTGVQTVNIDKPQTISAAIVTGYLQAVEDDVHQQLLNHHDNNDRCIMKIYQHSTGGPEMQVLSRQTTHSQPLPPLKKVLSSQSLLLRHKLAATPTVMVELPTTSILTRSDDDIGVKDSICKVSQNLVVPSSMQTVTTPIVTSAGQCTQVHGQTLAVPDELDSDYDVENDTRQSKRSLPHKKRIPRKLKAPAARNIHTKCYKCNKCGESFNTQTAFSAHRSVHTASSASKQRPGSNSLNLTSFNCELCSKQFNTQLTFFEHLKQHYEPISNSVNISNGSNHSSISSNGNIMDSDSVSSITMNGVNVRVKSDSNCSDDLSDLPPAPIVATCIAPIQLHDKLHSNTVPSQTISGMVMSADHQSVVETNISSQHNHSVASPMHQPLSGGYSIKDELIGPDIVKEEIVSSTGLSCGQCGEIFRRTKSFETHIATEHPRHIEIEEFSEPEDMMVDIRHAVNIADVDSADDCTQDDDQCSVDVDDKWKYQESIQELGMDLQDMCLPLPPATTIQSGEQDNHDNSVHSGANPNGISSISNENQRNSNRDCKINTIIVNNNAINSDIDSGVKKKQLNCSECDRTFNHRNSLLYHIRSHSGQRPHQCEVCGKSFFSASALKVHTRLHSGDKPYKCDFCGRNFRQWGDLKYHLTSLHSDQKQFQCEYCGKDFARKYSLIVHRRIHTGEKNYRCEYCTKTFRASSYLQNHRRIHTGEKPHSCDICGKPFRVRSDMKRHRQTHNRDRPSSTRQNTAASTPEVITPSEVDEDSAGPETILPDNAVSTPLNLNIRQGDSNDDSMSYSRTSLDRESNTLYVWIPAQDAHLLSDE